MLTRVSKLSWPTLVLGLLATLMLSPAKKLVLKDHLLRDIDRLLDFTELRERPLRITIKQVGPQSIQS